MRLFLIVLTVLIVFSCSKENKGFAPVEQSAPVKENNEFSMGDLAKYEKILEDAKILTPEVAIAITLLHHQYIRDLETTIFDKNISDVDKEVIFEAKKVEFFTPLRFSYEEYTDYVTTNNVAVNEYLARHPEIVKLLTLEN